MWIIFRELNANSVRFSVAAPPSSIFTEESSSNSMTRKDEIKAVAEPSPAVVVQNGKENIQKTEEKEMVSTAKTNMIQRASDQKRYKTIGCKPFLLLNHRGHIRNNTLC